jgi:hypothetical protein
MLLYTEENFIHQAMSFRWLQEVGWAISKYQLRSDAMVWRAAMAGWFCDVIFMDNPYSEAIRKSFANNIRGILTWFYTSTLLCQEFHYHMSRFLIIYLCPEKVPNLMVPALHQSRYYPGLYISQYY